MTKKERKFWEEEKRAMLAVKWLCISLAVFTGISSLRPPLTIPTVGAL